MAAALADFAPVPDFRYVGLEPVTPRGLRRLLASAGFGAGVSLALSGALSGISPHHALLAGALTSLGAAYAFRGVPRRAERRGDAGSARMAIVPWGVLVETFESPRILRWAAVQKVDVETSLGRHLLGGAVLSSRVSVHTAHDRFVGEAIGAVSLDRLVAHLDAYATEQATLLALDLEGEREDAALEPEEAAFEPLLAGAREWLATARAASRLGLAPAGYRRTSVLAATPLAIDVLRRVLRDRTPKRADPRAFAAVVAAELRANELVPDLLALAQCPHPLVAAVARQAARRLGAPEARTGTLDEVAPFLFDTDLARLTAWYSTRC